MDNRVVVITGAGSGLGASFAKKYSAMGYTVCLLGRTKKKLEQLAKILSNDYYIYELDVSSKSDVKRVFQAIKEEVGPVHLLINNAGVGIFALAEEIEEQAVHDMIDINLKGTIFCTQEVLPDMKSRNEGIIANIVSTAGLSGKVTESVYTASKFGVRGFTESLLAELEETNIRVYAAYMGGMKTPFWDGIYDDIDHLMDPDDIADIIMDNITLRNNLQVTEIIIKNKIV